MDNIQLQLTNGQQTISSLQLVAYINEHRKGEADNGGKSYIELLHKNFLAKVIEVLGENQSANFLADYKDIRNRDQKYYLFPEREACLMAMSYSYTLQAKVYDAFQAAKAKLNQISYQNSKIDKLFEMMADNNKKILELNSNLIALINNLAIKAEPKTETPKYFQPSEDNGNLDYHLYHRITIYGKKFRPDIDQTQIRERAREMGMIASRMSKERKIKIIEEENLDSRYPGKTKYYHQDILNEVFRLIF